MRNLKKVLALALAVVMLVGMMAMGASAATYEDVENNDHGVAIDVVSAIEAIQGSNGKFNPDGRLTRGDAAVIAARVALGRDVADKLVGASGVYSDVSAKAYYSGAIAWATNEGYLSGDGTGAFRPTGSLYGIHFAKMLLGVLGYDAEIEGFTGKDYVQKILLAGTMANLFEGLEDVELNGRITRGQAAQMAFNALNAHPVSYTGMSIELPGVGTITSGGGANRVENKTVTYGEVNYGLTYEEPEFDTDTVVGGYWYFVDEDGNDVLDAEGNRVLASAPAAVEPTHTIKYYKSAAALQEMLCNPVTKAPFTFDNTVATTYNRLSDISGSGVYIDIWANEGVIYKVEYTYDKIASVLAEYDEATELYTFTIDMDDNNGVDEIITFDDDEDALNTEYNALVALDLEVDEETFVVFSFDADYEGADWTAAAVAEKVTGTASEITDRNGFNFILNGDKYYVAEKAVYGRSLTASLTAVQDFWLDTYGNVLLIENVTETPDDLLIYVNNIAITAGEYNGDGTFANAYTLTGFDMAGNEVTFEMGASKTVKNSNWREGHTIDANAGSYTTLAEDELYVYTVNKQGKIATADLVDVTAFSADFDADTTLTFDGKYITADTKFAYVFEANLDGIPGNEEYFVVKTGAHNILAANVTGYYTIKATGNDLDMVILCGTPATPVAEPAEDLIFVESDRYRAAGAYYTIRNDGSILSADGETVVYTYSVYLNGEETTITRYTRDEVRYGWYNYIVDEYGVYTLSNTFDPAVDVVVNNENVYGNIALGNGRYYVTLESGDVVDITDAEIFNLTKVSASTAGRLLTLSNSAAYENVELAIHYSADVNGLLHAATIYVLNVFAAE